MRKETKQYKFSRMNYDVPLIKGMSAIMPFLIKFCGVSRIRSPSTLGCQSKDKVYDKLTVLESHRQPPSSFPHLTALDIPKSPFPFSHRHAQQERHIHADA